MPNHSFSTRAATHTDHWHSRLFLSLVLLALMLWNPAQVTAQETQPAANSQCFVVADGYLIDGDPDPKAGDTLAYLRLETGQAEPVGGLIPNLSTTSIEAIAFRPNSAELYAVDANQLGVIDLATATFSARPQPIGGANPQAFADVDGLSFHPLTGELWGVNVVPADLDRLLKIDINSGTYQAGAFTDPNNPGNPVDSLVIQSGSIVNDIDDIAIDPVDGVMYAIVTGLNNVASLAIIDTSNGNVTTIGQITRRSDGTALREVEGLGFAGDGQLYGSTGDLGNAPNLLWNIDKTTAVATLIGAFDDRLVDIEALDCLSSTGFLVFESYVAGIDADTTQEALTLRAGDPFTRTYLIRNTGAYTLTNVKVVDDNGTPDDGADDVTVCQDLNIPIGQSETCARNATAQPGQQRLVALVTGQDTLGNTYAQEDITYYTGYTGAAVGGRVWNDRNGNGLNDLTESDAGIDNVTVTLYNSNGVAITNTQTANGGAYLFNNLQPGTYALGVQLPPRYDFTLKDQPNDDTIDSDFEPNPAATDFGRTPNFTLADGVIDQSWDAGLISQIKTGSVSGYAWKDLNGDGIQNDGAPEVAALAGVTVTLNQRVEVRSVQVMSSTTTLDDGTYRFDNVPVGDYFIEFIAPEGYGFTTQNAGDSELIDSDASPESGRTDLIEIEAGTSRDNIDVGLRKSETTNTIYIPSVTKQQ